MRDAYQRVFEKFSISIDDLFGFGIEEIIHVPFDKATSEWTDLKSRIESEGKFAIRGYGRNGAGSQQFLDLYTSVFGHKGFEIDKTNNAKPTNVLQRMTGYSKNPRKGCEQLSNYQVSHVFGRTKNPYAFTAPWNVVYIPKILDPFTGHEASGDLAGQFQRAFRHYIFVIFEQLIEEFNDIVTKPVFVEMINEYLESESENERFKRDVREAFEPISVIAKI